MAKDDPLRSKLASLATASQGRVTFNVRTSRELGTEFDVDLGTSTNPVYDFTVTPTSGSPFRRAPTLGDNRIGMVQGQRTTHR